MIKINFMQFIYDRVWFGWWYKEWWSVNEGKWLRDPNPKYRYKIIKLQDAIKGGYYDTYKHRRAS